MKRSSDGAISNKLQPSTPPPLVAKACRSHPRVIDRWFHFLFAHFGAKKRLICSWQAPGYCPVMESSRLKYSQIFKAHRAGLKRTHTRTRAAPSAASSATSSPVKSVCCTGLVDLDISYLQGKKCLKWVISPVLAIVIGNMMILTTRFTIFYYDFRVPCVQTNRFNIGRLLFWICMICFRREMDCYRLLEVAFYIIPMNVRHPTAPQKNLSWSKGWLKIHHLPHELMASQLSEKVNDIE